MLRCTATSNYIPTKMAILEIPANEPYSRVDTPYGAGPAELALAVGGDRKSVV